MEVAVEIREDKPVLVYSGRLDDEASVRFGRELTAWVERMLNRNITDFIVDFSGVTFVSSVVLRSMLSMARRVRARGGVLCLSNPSPELEETFRVIGFREIFESYGGRLKVSAAAGPELDRTPSESVRLDVIIGDQVFVCRDGDSLGTEGSIAPQLFAGLPGVSGRHLFFRNTSDHWLAEASDDPGSIVRVDDQVVAPGQKVVLSRDHTLQIGEVRLRVLVTSPEKSEEEIEPIQIQIEDVFSRTATWLERAINADQEKHE
jgi:anti-sigma B factor antagonist